MYSLRTYGNVLKRHLKSSCKYGWASVRPQQTAAIVAKESFINGSSSNYVEEMYASWLENPSSVHKVRTISEIIFKFYIIAHATLHVACAHVVYNTPISLYSLENPFIISSKLSTQYLNNITSKWRHLRTSFTIALVSLRVFFTLLLNATPTNVT